MTAREAANAYRNLGRALLELSEARHFLSAAFAANEDMSNVADRASALQSVAAHAYQEAIGAGYGSPHWRRLCAEADVLGLVDSAALLRASSRWYEVASAICAEVPS